MMREKLKVISGRPVTFLTKNRNIGILKDKI